PDRGLRLGVSPDQTRTPPPPAGGRREVSKCRLGFTKHEKTWRIHNEWAKFISDVGLEKDDICLFELTDTLSLTLKVHVIRKSDIPTSM
ncbi:hypothetical protein CFC21_073263, partial [Triticum aestivum]